MGCDIHCYIEYKSPEYNGWYGFGGRINPGRNYSMFGAMAGVRCPDIDHIEPRGWPEDCAYDAFEDNTIYICETQQEPTSGEGDEFYYSRAHANEYVEKGYCKFVSRGGGQHWVTNSDHHSHSWLTADEFEKSMKDSGDDPKWLTEYRAMLAAMRSLESDGNQVRLVFWFDN